MSEELRTDIAVKLSASKSAAARWNEVFLYLSHISIAKHSTCLWHMAHFPLLPSTTSRGLIHTDVLIKPKGKVTGIQSE